MAAPEGCELRRFSGRSWEESEHPDARNPLQTATIEELDRHGLDPRIQDWLESEGASAFPDSYEATDSRNPSLGWRTCFRHPFNE